VLIWKLLTSMRSWTRNARLQRVARVEKVDRAN
jgi:hypothetical protein